MTSRPAPLDVTEILSEGPWQHRMVPANGARFHVAEAGQGPLVIMLHGFGQFWWEWRHQLPALAEAGYHAAAMDLRGFGASDKPPRGYDPATLCADVAGVIRALGHSSAVVVGHDWGGWLTWAMPLLQPAETRAIAPISMPHPLTVYAELPRHPRTALRMLSYQLPWLPQRRLARAEAIPNLVRTGWGLGTPEPNTLERYAAAAQLPTVASTSFNGFRTAGRGAGSRTGRRFRQAMAEPITVSVLALHGGQDRWFRASTVLTSRRHVVGPYRTRVLPEVGHLLPEEAPATLTHELRDWLAMLDGPVTLDIAEPTNISEPADISEPAQAIALAEDVQLAQRQPKPLAPGQRSGELASGRRPLPAGPANTSAEAPSARAPQC